MAAPPERVWALWADASMWPKWHKRIASAKLDGPLELGATAKIRFKGSLVATEFRVT